MKTPQQLAYIDRVVKSGGMDYLFDQDYFTNPGYVQVAEEVLAYQQQVTRMVGYN